jgi:hypothetical protein
MGVRDYDNNSYFLLLRLAILTRYLDILFAKNLTQCSMFRRIFHYDRMNEQNLILILEYKKSNSFNFNSQTEN